MNNEKLDYFMVSATMILSTLVLFVYNIYVRKYVMRYEYGIYTSANMLLLYLNYAQMGVLNSYNRDYPQLLGAKNYQAASHIKYCFHVSNNVVWHNIFSSNDPICF